MKILVTVPQGVILDTFFPSDVKERLMTFGEIEWNISTENDTPEQLREKLRDVDVCFSGWGTVLFDAYTLEYANKLKAIFHTGGTVGTITNEDTYKKGVRIFSGNDVYAKSVAESVIAYSLLSLRRLPYFLELMASSGWRETFFDNKGLLGQTVGLVGFGAIARHVVTMLKPFDTTIKVYSSYLTDDEAISLGVEVATLEEIFDTCSVISIHSPQSPKNFHLINKELIQKIKPGTLFINTARGSVVDEPALAEELKKGNFSAVLDVFEEEPLPIESSLRGLENALLIPHMGGPTLDQRRRVTHVLMDDLEKLASNGPFSHEISNEHAKRMTQ